MSTKRGQVKQAKQLSLYDKIERSRFCDYLFWTVETIIFVLGVLFFVIGDYYRGKSIMSLFIAGPIIVLFTKFVEDKYSRRIE